MTLFLRFLGDRLFGCCLSRDLGDVVGPIYLPTALLVLALLAVGLHLRFEMAVLLSFDQSQRVAKTLVHNDRSLADSLILAEYAVGKQKAL